MNAEAVKLWLERIGLVLEFAAFRLAGPELFQDKLAHWESELRKNLKARADRARKNLEAINDILDIFFVLIPEVVATPMLAIMRVALLLLRTVARREQPFGHYLALGVICFIASFIVRLTATFIHVGTGAP